MAMLLALWQTVLHQLLSIQLAPMHLRAGKGPAGTLNANRSLDNFKSQTCIHHPLDQAEVASGQGLIRPQPNYEALHGLFGRLVELDQLLQLVAKGHRMFGPSILRPTQLFRQAPFLGPIELRDIRYVTG